jgi:hypothetical protein
VYRCCPTCPGGAAGVGGTEPDATVAQGMERTVVHGEVPEAELTCYAIDVRDDHDHEL